jgi:hypothetical protein
MATATVVNSTTLKLTLAPDTSAAAWVGSTTYLAEAATANSSPEALSFRVVFKQIQNYAFNAIALEAIKQEGSGTDPTVMRVRISIDSPALSDLTISWSVNGTGLQQASATDFAGSTLPSGTAIIRKGSQEAIIVLQIQADLTQEPNEEFEISFTNQSDQIINTSAATTTLTIANDDLTTLSGTVTYWKNNTPLDNINLNIARSSISASSDGTIQFRNIVRNDADGTLTASLWADSGGTGFSNVDFSFNKASDPNFSIALNTSLFNGDWLTSINNSPAAYNFSAISLVSQAGNIKIADITSSIPSPTSSSVAYLEYGRVGDTLLQETRFEASEQLELINGEFAFNTTNGSFTAQLSKDPITGIERRAIDSKDALLALKMSSGSITGSDLESQAQWIAADVDQNGQVQAKDAWLINQYNVGNTPSGSEVGTWEFIDSAALLAGLSATNAAAPTSAAISEITVSQSQDPLAITAILNGDIDGSYVNL